MKPTEISPTCRCELDPTSGIEHNPTIGSHTDLLLDDIVAISLLRREVTTKPG